VKKIFIIDDNDTNLMAAKTALDGTYKAFSLTLLLPSAQLHDVGKIIIGDLILNKPGKLTDEEFDIIKQHCVEGERIIDEIIRKTTDDGFLLHAKRFAGAHHEKWNGTGYPRRFKEEQIPLEGRIMAIADVYDALVSERPYKKPFTHEQAVDIIKQGSGTHLWGVSGICLRFLSWAALTGSISFVSIPGINGVPVRRWGAFV